MDALIAATLAVAGQLNLWLGFDGYYGGGPRALNVVLTAVVTVSLSWRRGAPLAVLGVIFVAFPFARALGAGMTFWGDFVPFFVAAGTVAAEEQGRRRFAGLVLPAVGFLIQLDRPGARSWNDAAFFALVLTVSYGLGDALRRFRNRALVLARRTVELELAHETAVARERARIARELHDVISHNVTVVVIQAAGAERLLGRDRGEVGEVLRRVQEAGREALAEMQLLLGVLRGGADEEDELRAPRPSLARLDALVAQVREAGVPVEFDLDGDPRGLPAAVDLSAYRIVQEALTNVLRHAPGAPTTLSVRLSPAAVELAVRNDAVNAQANRHTSGSGQGLLGMRERVQLLGGRFQASSTTDGGFAIRASLPVEP
jgi:signal transduction histidine kinase